MNLRRIATHCLAAGLIASPLVFGAPDLPSGHELLAGMPQEELSKNGVYIVRLADNPVAAYEGGIKGLRATKPKGKQKLNPNDPAVIAYADYLVDQQDAVLRKVGGAKKVHSYKYSYNGFAAKLTERQLRALRKMPEVISVTTDELLQPSTISTPDMLDLREGLWEELGGVDNAGEGVIVGIIDSGVWPESESFSDRTGSNKKGKSGKLSFQQIPGWHGRCVPGEAFTASNCNQKLIGAQYFNAGFGGDAGIKAVLPYEFLSPRDADGHGTHTASTAAGNADVPVVINGDEVGVASGMAPRARVAAYKVCWGISPEGGCFSSDSVAAIDQAVIDGVDVLNFSISGSLASSLDPVEVAFLFAADAGVFVAASAGNSGPGAETVAHNVPWLTTVAAGTHDRAWEGTVTGGDGAEYQGATLGSGVSGDLVYSADIVAAGEDQQEGTLCVPGTLDPILAAGKVVLCDRGAIARVDKSLAVAQAGGIGMILANVAPSSVNADFHSIPSIHVDHIAGAALRAYAQTDSATADISAGEKVTAEASEVAEFSSRGPALAGNGDLLKPDIMAPGVDVIAAVSPYAADGTTDGNNFDALSGTSMSSPHMAGLGALMKQRHPGWSPAMIKSAFMTSATTLTNQGNPITGGALDYGAGFVQPNAAENPGLVYDAGWVDWLGYLCGTGELTASYCPVIGIDPSDLNYPSIAIGALAGTQTVKRSVTNVGDTTGNFSVSVIAPPGIDVEVTPASLELNRGETGDYHVTFTTGPGAVIGSFAEGSLNWSDGVTGVRSPIVVRPVELAAPEEIAGMGTDGSVVYDITFGTGGPFAANIAGIAAAERQEDNVVDDPANDINTALATGVGITVHFVPVAPGAVHQRISLFDDYTDGNDDLDLYVYTSSFGYVGGSGSGTSAEQVDIPNPLDPFGYYVVVHGWQTDGPDANYTLFSFSVGADEGNASVDVPDDAVLGASAEVTVDWSGLDDSTKHMGVISYDVNGTEVGRTILRVDTD